MGRCSGGAGALGGGLRGGGRLILVGWGPRDDPMGNAEKGFEFTFIKFLATGLRTCMLFCMLFFIVFCIFVK